MAVFPLQQTPTIVQSCRLWLDATDPSTITQSGGFVSVWNDKSGFKFNMSEGTGANQPSYEATGMNSMPCLAFADTQRLSNSTWGNAQQRFHVFAVKSFTGTSNGSNCIGVGNTITNSLASYFIRNDPSPVGNSGFIYDGVTFEPACRLQDNAGQSAAAIISFTYNGTQLTLKRNNTTSTSQSRSVTIQAGTGLVKILGNTTANGAVMRVGELLIFQSSLSSNDELIVYRYLANKWGIDIG